MTVCRIICDYLMSRKGLEIDVCGLRIVDKTMNIAYDFKNYDELINHLHDITCHEHGKPMIHEPIIVFTCKDKAYDILEDTICNNGGIELDKVLDKINKFIICKYDTKNEEECIKQT